MASSTAGPWDWIAIGANASGGHHLYITDGNGRKIAALWGKADEKAANARLIVAAPELLAALVGVVAVADRETDEFIRARAAIAAAKGGA